MRIELNQVVLRTALKEDAPVITKWWNDGTVMAHAGFPNGLGETIQSVEKQLGFNTIKSQVMIIELDQKPIGEMCYSILHHQAEIGIKICESKEQNHGRRSLIDLRMWKWGMLCTISF